MKLLSFSLILCLLLSLLTGCSNNNANNNLSKASSSVEISTNVNSTGLKEDENVLNNGSACLQYKDKVYFAQATYNPDTGYHYQLDRIDINTKEIENLFQSDYYSEFYIYQDNLYFNSENGTIGDIISLDINTKKAVHLFKKCTMLYFDLDTATIYFTKNDFNDLHDNYLLCSANSDGSNVKTLFKSGKITIDTAYKTGGNLYFTGGSEDNKSTPSYIYSYIPNSLVLRQITADKSADDSPRSFRAHNLVYSDGWIYYATGDIEGSGAYFYGDIFRVKPDGSNKIHIDEVSSWNFTIQNGHIYYGGEYSKYTEPKNYLKVAKVDGTDKKSFNGVAGSIVCTNKNYIYRYGCDTEHYNFFYRTDLNGNNAKTLITVLQDDKDCSEEIAKRLEDAYVVGDWIYYMITKHDESCSKMNGNIPIYFKYYKMKIDGTDNQLLLTVNANE